MLGQTFGKSSRVKIARPGTNLLHKNVQSSEIMRESRGLDTTLITFMKITNMGTKLKHLHAPGLLL